MSKNKVTVQEEAKTGEKINVNEDQVKTSWLE